MAYSAATGRRLWVSRYNGPGNGDDDASAVAVSPDGGTVFVTGRARPDRPVRLRHRGLQHRDGQAAVGQPVQRPRERRRQCAGGGGEPRRGHGVRDRGSDGPNGLTDYDGRLQHGHRQAVVGQPLRPSRPGNGVDDASAVAVSPDGRTVFVTGSSVGRANVDDYATVAYSAATGRRLWASRYGEAGATRWR